jgi:uncharacterized protein (TIGR02001 family)
MLRDDSLVRIQGMTCSLACERGAHRAVVRLPDMFGTPFSRVRESFESIGGFICYLSLSMGACLPVATHAQSTTVSGTVAISSQLVDRGQAITPETPVLQGAASLALPSRWSIGVSASVEARSPDHIVQALAQASRYWVLSSDWQMQVNLAYYDYPNDSHTKAFDRIEAGLGWFYRDVLSLDVSAIYPVGKVEHRPLGALDINVHWPLPKHFYISAGMGVTQAITTHYGYYEYSSATSYDYGQVAYYQYSEVKTYGYGNIGLLWSHGPWHVELDRILTAGLPERPGYPDTASWVATISRSF